MRFLEGYDTSYKCGALVLLGWRKRAPTKSPSKNSRLWWDWVFVFDRCRFHWKLHRDVIETGWIFLWFFTLLPVKLWNIFDTARFGRNDIMRFLEKYDTSYKCGALVLLGWRKRAPTKSPSKNSRLWWDWVFVFDRFRFHWKLHRDVIETGWIFLWFFMLLPVKLWKRVGRRMRKHIDPPHCVWLWDEGIFDAQQLSTAVGNLVVLRARHLSSFHGCNVRLKRPH